ncbi:MAG TPA: response regulator transcription factor [Anaerolineales bacterium]|nr:response regulator transcription factor [Anaerolineales bacterium]
MTLAHILVIEDDYIVARTIERCLQHQDFQVTLVSRGDKGLQSARQNRPDLIILDIIMPDMDGYTVCKAIRADSWLAQVPVLLLTAKVKTQDKISGFKAGADDYLCKPFNLDELTLRVKAILRRTKNLPTNEPDAGSEEMSIASGDSIPSFCLVLGDFILDTRSYELQTPNKGKIRLTPMQYDLLYHLMTHPGETFSPARLLDEVWDYPSGKGSPDLVRVHIKTLRERIEENPSSPRFLCTIPGQGYVISPTNP